MIQDEICTYEVCKLAKEKGFDVPTNFCYEQNGCLVRCGSIAAPTQSLLQRWLRDEKMISVEVSWFEVGKKYFWVVKDMNNPDVFKPKATKCMTFYDTWEQALESGLKYALKELNSYDK